MVSFTAEQRFIVTGASSGIGEGVALLLNELGATVIGIGRNVERLNGMKAKTKNPENMFLEKKNLVEDIQGLPVYVKELKEKYGKFSGMVYCAGVSALMPAKAYDFSYAQEIFLNNYFAPLFMTKGLIDKRNTVGRGTAIVIISSIDAILATRGQSLYSGAKGALCSTMRAISKEITPYGYRVTVKFEGGATELMQFEHRVSQSNSEQETVKIEIPSIKLTEKFNNYEDRINMMLFDHAMRYMYSLKPRKELTQGTEKFDRLDAAYCTLISEVMTKRYGFTMSVTR